MNTSEGIAILKKGGYKVTDKREDILYFFSQSNGYRTARDLLNFMRERYAGISFDTIYRNLHLFHKLNILEKTELQGESNFRMTCDTNTHHHHFICVKCSKTKKIEACPMQLINRDLDDYRIEGHKFEIYGRCPECIK